jgi:carbamoyl-phosphate synthase large subunit
LVEFFRAALGGVGSVYAADADMHAAALQEADKAFVVPPVHDPTYIARLVKLCVDHAVRILVPLNDLELPVLAQHRNDFLAVGTVPVISSTRVVDLCSDKWATYNFLGAAGVRQPRTYLSLTEAREALRQGCMSYPVVVKPRWGTASIGIEYPEDDDELKLAYQWITRKVSRGMLAAASQLDCERAILIQERLAGQEYGLDVVNDLDSRYVTTFARQKLAMRAGETDRASTVELEGLQALGRLLGNSIGHVGNLDCDVFLAPDGWYVLEMNPRFGGGYPFSHAAGANLPAMLIAWTYGRPVNPRVLRSEPGIILSKCDRLVQHRASRCALEQSSSPP